MKDNEYKGKKKPFNDKPKELSREELEAGKKDYVPSYSEKQLMDKILVDISLYLQRKLGMMVQVAWCDKVTATVRIPYGVPAKAHYFTDKGAKSVEVKCNINEEKETVEVKFLDHKEVYNHIKISHGKMNYNSDLELPKVIIDNQKLIEPSHDRRGFGPKNFRSGNGERKETPKKYDSNDDYDVLDMIMMAGSDGLSDAEKSYLGLD
jgi:hypothetical protein